VCRPACSPLSPNICLKKYDLLVAQVVRFSIDHLLCNVHTALSASQHQKHQGLLMDWIFSVLVQTGLSSQLPQSLISWKLCVEQLLHKLEQYLVKQKQMSLSNISLASPPL